MCVCVWLAVYGALISNHKHRIGNFVASSLKLLVVMVALFNITLLLSLLVVFFNLQPVQQLYATLVDAAR